MMYPYLTLSDGTEIVYSDVLPDGRVKVYIEKPDENVCFRHATCYLPGYDWEDVYEFSDDDIVRYEKILQSDAPLIMGRNHTY